MRSTYFKLPLMALLVSLPQVTLAADIVGDSKVVEATVYEDRATVTRQASIDLPEGASVVVLQGLPLSLMTDSLRAEGKATADVTLGALETKTITSTELAAPRERELESKITALQDQKNLISADITALSQKQKFLEGLALQANMRARENIAAIELKPEQWSAAANTIADQLSSLLKTQATKSIEIRELDKQVTALQEELQSLQTGQTNAIQIRVPLESKSATRLTLKVSYQVPGASWRPVYDARLDTESQTVQLTQFGEVTQQTGEDWPDVALKLSTAQPSQQVSLPPITPLWVAAYDQRQAFDKLNSMVAMIENREMMMKADSLAEAPAMVAAAPAPQERAATFQTANLAATGYAAEYRIVGPSTVLADGSSRKVMVGNIASKVTLQDVVAPQFDAAAYLVAKTQIEGESPLLPGVANLFRDGTFIGSTPVEMVRPGSQIDLAFGKDDQIEVKRDLIKDETGESGVLVGKSKTISRQVKFSIANLHKKPIELAVKYRLPVPQNDTIQVKLDEKFTTPADFVANADDTTGLMLWKVTAAAKEKKVFQVGWSLSWPADQRLDFNSQW